MGCYCDVMLISNEQHSIYARNESRYLYHHELLSPICTVQVLRVCIYVYIRETVQKKNTLL